MGLVPKERGRKGITPDFTVCALVSAKCMQQERIEGGVEFMCVCVRVGEDPVCPKGCLIHALAYSNYQMSGYVTAEAD